MNISTFKRIERAIGKEDVGAFGKAVTTLDVLTAAISIDGQETSIAEVLLASQTSAYLAFLNALCLNDITPAQPDVDALGLFRVGNILKNLRYSTASGAEVITALRLYRGMAPAAPLHSCHGIHPLLMLFHERWSVSLFRCVLEMEEGLEFLGALDWLPFESNASAFQKLKILLDAGADPNSLHAAPDRFGVGPMEQLLQEHSFSLPKLYLLMAYGAQDATFLPRLLAIKKKNRQPHIYPLCKTYLSMASNQHHANDTTTGASPLHLAVISKDIPTIQLLLAVGATPDLPATRAKSFKKVKIKKGTTPLMLAEMGGDVAVLRCFDEIENLSPPVDMEIDALRDALNAPCPVVDLFYEMIDRLKKRSDIHMFAMPGGARADASTSLDDATLSIILALWPDPNPQQILALQVGLLIGGQRCAWRLGDDASGGFTVADWIEMLTNGKLCDHEDIGVTYCKPTKNSMRLFCRATYNDHKTYTVRLSLESYFERLFQVAGLQYWMYCFFPNATAEVVSLPFFPESLASLNPPGDVSLFLSPFEQDT